MKAKYFWLIAGVLFLGVEILSFVFFDKPRVDERFNVILLLMALGLPALVTFLAGGLLGSLSALIPFRAKTYWQKLSYTLPFSFSVLLLLFISIYAIPLAAGHSMPPGMKPFRKYSNVKIPKGLDCSSVHVGKFKMEGLELERTASTQSETDLKTGEKKEYEVLWISACEYSLKPITDLTTPRRKIKIVAVTADGYDCFVSHAGTTNGYSSLIHLTRVFEMDQ